jgi:hypothetical protein
MTGMDKMKDIFESYFMTLVHPFRIHQQFRHQLPLPNQNGYLYRPLTLAEGLGVSWIFAILRGLGKIIILVFFLNFFLNLQSEEFPFLQDLIHSSSITTYSFLLFSSSLDIVFFPIAGLIVTEFWAWVIRTYSGWLNPDLDADTVADQITVHALSSNLFSMVPILGDLIQPVIYYFLLYAGIRSNLGASRALTFVILITPTILLFMFFSVLMLAVFYLVS